MSSLPADADPTTRLSSFQHQIFDALLGLLMLDFKVTEQSPSNGIPPPKAKILLSFFKVGNLVMVLVLQVALVLALSWIIRKILCDPLRDIPGPWLARWSSLWIVYQARAGRKWLVVDELHKKYGTFVRLAPHHVSVADKDALPIIYGRGSSAMPKASFYNTFVDEIPSIFSAIDRKLHTHKSRLISPAFSYRSLQSLVPMIQDIVDSWVVQLDKLCEQKEPISLLEWFHFLGFDVVSDLAFGEKLGMIANGSDIVETQRDDGRIQRVSAMKVIDDRENFRNIVGFMPWLDRIAKLIPDPVFMNGLSGCSAVVDFARACVLKRLDSSKSRDDILGSLIQAYTEDGKKDTDQILDELVRDAITLLIAGADSISCSMGAIVYYVLSNPHAHNKLLAELGNVYGPEDVIAYERVKDLPYLQACIDEGMRLYTVLSLGLPREVPQGGVECCGKFFPEGVDLSVPQLSIHRNDEIWTDPNAFKPERFLESDQSHKRYLMSFGMGSRACIGRNLAQIEMYLTLATLFIRYDLTLLSQKLDISEGFMTKPVDIQVLMRRKAV